MCMLLSLLYTRVNWLLNTKIDRYYKDYFDVNNEDISARIKCALFMDDRFVIVANEKPDLYKLLLLYLVMAHFG